MRLCGGGVVVVVVGGEGRGVGGRGGIADERCGRGGGWGGWCMSLIRQMQRGGRRAGELLKG